MKRLLRCGLLLILLALPARVQGQFVLRNVVFGAAAVTGESTSYHVRGTLGEPFVGRAASSSFIVTLGFWATVPPETTAPTAIETIDSDAVPERFSLDQNFPNPFNPATRIRYALAEPTSARLTIYDVLGREVSVLVDRPQAAGTYEVVFEAGSLPSGLYFYQLRAGRFSSIRQMSLIK